MMGLLISAEQLSEKQNCLIFDCSFSLTDSAAGRRQYTASHIPGAHYVDLKQDLSGEPGLGGRHPLPERERFGEQLRAWGVNKDSTVVCYDQNVSAYASRLWWMVRWLGHEDVHVLDGGLATWQAAGFNTESTVTVRTPGDFTAGDPLTRVREAGDLPDPNRTLIDAREEKRFLGIEEPIDPVAGHIPGALCAPFNENLTDGYFLSSEALRQRFTDIFADLASSNDVVCYCGSGVTATHNILALMLAGFDEPALYPGSWSEWITDPDRPIATGL